MLRFKVQKALLRCLGSEKVTSPFEVYSLSRTKTSSNQEVNSYSQFSDIPQGLTIRESPQDRKKMVIPSRSGDVWHDNAAR
jgi:hypothetical protein